MRGSMKRQQSVLFLASIIGLTPIVCLGDCAAQQSVASENSLSVLVDASKDGGEWWFPQGPPRFDAERYHQGKGLADSMRAKGWMVAELPRGETVAFNKLREFDVVIRPPSFFSYTQAEAVAYRNSVAAGTRLVLVGGGGGEDLVAAVFGLRFERHSAISSVHKWIPHALTAHIECCNVSWTPIAVAPKGAVALAWLETHNLTERPVLGYYRFGKGYVIFIGRSVISHTPNDEFTDDLLNALRQIGTHTVLEQSVAPSVGANHSIAVTTPVLVEPIDNTILPQPYAGAWRFD